MKRKQIRRMLIKSFIIAGADKIIGIYFIWFFIAAVPVWIFEPGIKNYADSLWFCFASSTTIGYGDYVAVTFVGRIVIVLLSVYSVAVIAIFTAVITGFFSDLARFRASENARAFIYELEHLPELSKEELEDLSNRVKNFNSKR